MGEIFHIRLGIGAKLGAFLLVLLVVSTASLVFLSNRLFVQDNTALIQQMNADSAAALSQQMRDHFAHQSQQMRQLGTVAMKNGGAQQNNITSALFFRENPEFYALSIFAHPRQGAPRVFTQIIAPNLTAHVQRVSQTFSRLTTGNRSFSLEALAKGEPQITSVRIPDGTAALAVGIPFVRDEKDTSTLYTLVALVRREKLIEAFGSEDLVTRFLVDRQGVLLAHPEEERVTKQENVAHLAIVSQFLKGKFNNSQTRYQDPETGEGKLGAYRMVGFAGLGVIAEVPEEKAFEAARRVEYRAYLSGAMILFLSLFFGYLFSKSITSPINTLVRAARQIAAGDFRLDLRPKTRDEVGYLSLAFNKMAHGLAEREKLKDTFNKYHSEEIANKILSGEVKLGGERMHATILFCDIRNFTQLSESMAPEAVVELLNEYLTRMVKIIREFNGVVEKYVGDAIMATWGVPLAHTEDTFRAVSACLAIRSELALLNQERIGRGDVPLYIGMGLNAGAVTAGNIGSDERMEYTVIGDTVNTASRIESMTKTLGVDLLIAEPVFKQVEKVFLCEAVQEVRVKGKAEALRVFRVNGYYGRDRQPILVETPYSNYPPQKSDKVEAA